MIDISKKKCYTKHMSSYELSAEQKGYYLFRLRGNYYTHAHFHGAVEFLFVQSGEQEVIIDGERRTLKAGEACFADSFSVHAYARSPEALVYILLGERQYFDRCFSAFGNKVPPKFFEFSDFDLLSSLIALCEKNWSNEVYKQETFEGCIKILCSVIAENISLVIINIINIGLGFFDFKNIADQITHTRLLQYQPESERTPNAAVTKNKPRG